MNRFEHGGNVYVHDSCVDFSANTNPLGMPQLARDALLNNIDAFTRYPDPACTELTRALATFEEVPPEWVLACAGASDAFARICSAVRPCRALVCAPCYSGYEQALEQVGAKVVVHELDCNKGFCLEESAIPESGIDLIFVANPNNPTGRCIRRDVLISILDEAKDRAAIVVLDECFVDLTECGRSNDLLNTYCNLVIVKAFTKTFALAGLRLGYALCADAQLLERLRAAGQPWAVSVPAQLAGVACVEDEEYLPRSLDLIAQERERMRRAFASHGLQVVPSVANYLLFRGPRDLYEQLLCRRILVRPCNNYRGLDKSWNRVAVLLPHENELLLDALREVLL